MISLELSAIAAPLGVTRVARVTGLDRLGVEVICAIRPFGHVLQVCNGKGATVMDAGRSAMGEAAELFAAENPDHGRMIFGSTEDMLGWGLDPVPLELCGEIVAEDLVAPSLRLGWVPAVDLVTQENVFVPAPAVHCVSQDDPPIGPPIYRWTTNGMGAHTQPAKALLHALYEAIERDHLAQVLPEGWTEDAIAARKLRAPPRAVGPLVAQLEAAGFEVHLFDLFGGKMRLPLVAAMIADREEGPIPLTAGYACRARYADAFTAALLEAAQSRLTDIHGAREDVDHSSRADERQLAELCRRIPGTRITDASLGPRTDEAALNVILTGLRGGEGAWAAWLPLPVPGWIAVKVLIAGYRVSELL